ncbi:MAG: hypothetical protein B5766_05420 [Candidatus Lumbricidophila eiseniae]|uniref:Uncharacterized protein n=1 Tax=Candidatus Lumbricidiphila eiseniae TaxID=1969409 RepID=A0A2A6FSB6_9MICO|nr:MAG: hypothetical protein B5766_05420 [Candidatus Lumbricidophila eiseniae]
MSLDLGSYRTGQFFTLFSVSTLTAQMTIRGTDDPHATLAAVHQRGDHLRPRIHCPLDPRPKRPMYESEHPDGTH